MNTHKVTPKDFFLWVGTMAALYGSVVSFITLIFSYINYTFPDALSYSYVDPFSGSMRFQMATLIVLVPVMLVLMRLIRKDIAAHAEKSELWIRRWALFLTVFLAGAAIIGDLITLINYFLGGELTTRFLLKVLTLLLVAGGVFMHFLADLRGYWIERPDRARMVGWAAAVVVVVAIFSGFLIMGSPAQVRLYRFDTQKVSDLQSIQWQIVNYWQQKEKLPTTLAETEDPIGGYVVPMDPESGDAYLYEVTGPMSFKLCANFNTESLDAQKQASIETPYYGGVMEGENWVHGAGKTCFDRTIDPERYPPYAKPAR